jgi:hypothetical protein
MLKALNAHVLCENVCREGGGVCVKDIACRCVPLRRTASYGTICGNVCGRYVFFATFKKKNVGDFSDIM